MRAFPIALAAIVPSWVGLTGCQEPIAAPSAFSEERYLCDAEHRAEFDAIVARCRDDHLRDASCSGIISFRGTIDSQEVVLDSPTTMVVRPERITPGGIKTDGLRFWATAPYFEFRLTIADTSAPSTQPSSDAGSIGSNFDFIDLRARGGNYLTAWTNETRDIQLLTPSEVRFAFTTDLLRGGHLEGCLDIFAATTP
jgi:hypothetical protein